MTNVRIRTLFQSCAQEMFHKSNVKNIKTRVMDGSIGRNMLGAEVMPEATKGEILMHADGFYIQKVGRSLLVAHAEHLIPVKLNVGDNVEIQHSGFKGTEKEDEPREDGMNYGIIKFSRKELACPVDDDNLRDLTRQLSEMRLPDGRRGLHLLHDLKYTNFRGTPGTKTNPYLEFEVEGAKFQGTVRLEYVLGADTYSVFFTKGGTQVDVHENVLFTETLQLLEEICDSSAARLATVTYPGKKKKPSAPATA